MRDCVFICLGTRLWSICASHLFLLNILLQLSTISIFHIFHNVAFSFAFKREESRPPLAGMSGLHDPENPCVFLDLSVDGSQRKPRTLIVKSTDLLVARRCSRWQNSVRAAGRRCPENGRKLQSAVHVRVWFWLNATPTHPPLNTKQLTATFCPLRRLQGILHPPHCSGLYYSGWGLYKG